MITETEPVDEEWKVIERLLPGGWEEQARIAGAFRRARYTRSPAALLRILLLHGASNHGLRETAAQARAAGVAQMSAVALLKRLRTAGDWLCWIAAELCRSFREARSLPTGLRPRALDSTTIQGPASKGTEWRLHYTLDLVTLACDWHELTDAHGAEALERTPVAPGDVLIADRNYLRPAGVRAVLEQGGQVIVRLRWCHPGMVDGRGRKLQALHVARRLRVGEVGDRPAWLVERGTKSVAGRIVAVKLPLPLAHRAELRAARSAAKKKRRADPRSLEAARYVMLFTTLPARALDAPSVLELYRFRWQVELAFKRHKQLLRLGQLPHKDPAAARSWILAKLVVALLLELLYRNAIAFSPWGYPLRQP